MFLLMWETLKFIVRFLEVLEGCVRERKRHPQIINNVLKIHQTIILKQHTQSNIWGQKTIVLSEDMRAKQWRSYSGELNQNS